MTGTASGEKTERVVLGFHSIEMDGGPIARTTVADKDKIAKDDQEDITEITK
jgi:hypothetical protein